MSEAVIGMLCYTYYQEVRNDLSENLSIAIQSNYFSNEVLTEEFDRIQSRVRSIQLTCLNFTIFYTF